MKLIDVHPDNVAKTGFFCYMSQKNSAGYRKKLAWLKMRFKEGLRIKMLDLKAGGRVFIEYIPGEYAWRSVYAEDFMVIHCIWVVGRSKGMGYGALLLDQCIEDAKNAGLDGVAIVTSSGNWLVGNRFLYRQGFETVDQAPPSFELMVKRFRRGSTPVFPNNWKERIRLYGQGLIVVRTDQCPYLEDAENAVKATAKQRKLAFRSVKLLNSQQILKAAPTPYGVFSILFNGQLVSYHYLLQKELVSRLDHIQPK